MAPMHRPEDIGPTEPKTRLTSVDAVRGFALFGVLLVNMYNFGAYSTEWTGLADKVSFTFMHALFETKSWRLFSFLFGFGFALQMIKLTTQEDGSIWFYVRRLSILALLGAAHALFYRGDILLDYALLGVILIAFRKLPNNGILALTVVLLAVYPVGNLVENLTGGEPVVETEPTPSLAERREAHPYLGSLGDVISANAPRVLPNMRPDLFGPESTLAIFAMFLLGLYAGRSRIFHEVPRHIQLIRGVFRWGLGIGIIAAVIEGALTQYFGYEVFRDSTASVGVQFIGDILFAFGATLLALGYAAGIVLLAHNGKLRLIRRWFEDLGRMALTVYLSGTAMFTLLFFGYGFGQIFLLGPTEVTGFAILFFTIQIAFCTWWLKHFRFGPMEWVWRSLTYIKAQPIRIIG